MPEYLTGVLMAFATPFVHGWANILDGYFSIKIFKRLTTLIFFSALINIALLPVVFFIDFPHFLSFRLLVIVFIIALIEVIYQYPYYWSLRWTDTSIVSSLFSLGKILVSLFAFLLVGERLNIYQYLGFLVIILSSTFLTLDFKRFHFNSALWLMLIVSIILSLQSVLYKYAFESGASWGSVFTWFSITEFIIAGIFMLSPKNIHDLSMSSNSNTKRALPLVLLAQILTWIGEATSSYALLLIPTSVVKGIDSIQAILVLFYAALFAKWVPKLFREHLGPDGLRKKLVLLILIAVGTAFVAFD